MIANIVFAAMSVQTWQFDIGPKHVLVFNRQDEAVVSWVNDSPRNATPSDLEKAAFRKYDLASGSLFVHKGVDRLASLRSQNEFLGHVMAQVKTGSHVVDLTMIPLASVRELLQATRFGQSPPDFAQDIALRSRAFVIPTHTVFFESPKKLTAYHRFIHARGADREGDTKSVVVTALEPAKTSHFTVLGPSQWGIGTPGNLPFRNEEELVVGALIHEFLEMVATEAKTNDNLLKDLAIRVADLDPLSKELRNLKKGQSFASLSPELQDAMRREARDWYQLNGFGSPDEAVAFLETATFRGVRVEPYLHLNTVNPDPRIGGGSFPLRRF